MVLNKIKNLIGKKGNYISQVVILSMIFGFGAGVVGQIVADVYIDPWRQDYVMQGIYNNFDATPLIPELRRVERFLGIEQDFEVNKSVAKINSALVGIYKKKATGSENNLNQVYLAKDLIATGFALTSDGWLVSHGSALGSLKGADLVVVFNNRLFPVEQMILDDVTKVVFIKIAANNLGITVLGDSKESTLGQLALAMNHIGQVAVVNIKDSNYREFNSPQDYIFSSENYDYSFLVSEGLSDSYLGSPLVNLGGEVIGIVYEIKDDGQALVVPINQFKSIVLDVLRNSTVKRPLLGVKYVDLAKAIGFNNLSAQGFGLGAYVYQAPDRGTPASVAGLKIGDIIISVDGQSINKNSNLTELIQQYQAGDEVNIEFLRNGSILEVDLVLSVLP